MFTGGGASWAEAQMKAGAYRIEPAPSGSRPNLDGLSCRWNPIASRSGEIVSIIALPAPAHDPAAFRALVTDVVGLAEQSGRGGRPVSGEGMSFSLVPAGLDDEARTVAQGRRLRKKLSVLAQMARLEAMERL